MNTEWKTLPLDEAFWFQEGPGVRKWQFTDSGVKLLNVANIEKSGELNLSKTDRHLNEIEVESKYSHFLIDDGDLVIASSGISFDKDELLRTRGAFVNKHHLPLCLNTSTIRFKNKEGISDLRFFKFWLDSLEFRVQITKLVTGSAQQNFGPSHLKATKISLPPIDQQKRIAAILDKAEELRRLRRQSIRYTVNPGDVIITIMGTCGRCAVVPNDIPLAINTKHLCCITLDQNKCLSKFLQAYFLMHPIANQYLNQTMKGAIMAGLNMNIIKAMPIPIPPLSLQQEFAQRIGTIESLKAQHRESLAYLDTLFASLQHRAFRGEL
jgi:restriction endonuclease S subunit